MSDEEIKIFERSQEFKSLEKLLRSTQAFKAPDYDVEAELAKLRSKDAFKNKSIGSFRLWPVFRIAAVLVLVMITFFYFFINHTTTVKTDPAERTSIYLPDSSEVILNAFTTVAFKERGWKNNRTVQMDGEAFFKVTKGSKFDVATTMGTVTVLGTSFNVKSRPGYFEITCYEGSVEVKSGNEVARLLPGKAVRILDGKIAHMSVVSVGTPAWLHGESSFKSVPFVHVIRELERQYGIEVIFQSTKDEQLFTGKFPHENLSLAIRAISAPFHLKYEFAEKNKVILSKEDD